MARIAKSSRNKAAKPAVKGRGPGRSPATAAKSAATAKRPKVTPVAATRRAVSAPPAVQKVSKDELRAQVEKLERGNATLRAKNREATRAAKTAAARVAELEEQVAGLEKQLAARTTAASGGRPPSASKPASPLKSGRRPKRRAIDPGDALPPGVAVEDPARPDLEAETARENLEEHLGEQAAKNETLPRTEMSPLPSPPEEPADRMPETPTS
jgi:hypothetical protein